MKKIATLALALLLLPSANIFAASENDQMINKDNKIETTSQARDEKASQTDLYEVSEVFENTVTLKFVQTVDGNSIPSYNGAEYNVPKEKFAEKDINVGDLYKINHDDIIMPSNPAQFGTIYSIEKEEKSDNKENEDVKEELITEQFVVEKVNEDGYTIADTKNKDNKYIISKKDANNMDLNVGDQLEITHNGVVLESNPAQFGKIFDLKKSEKEKTEKNENEETITETFIVDEITEKGYNIHEKSNKDNKYYISKEDTKTLDLAIGDQLKITHTGLATRSIPAQFVGDIKVRKINNKESDTKKNINKKEIEQKPSKKTSEFSKEKINTKKNIGNSKINSTNKNINANKLAGLNPKTGVFSSLGIVGVGAAAGILSKNTKE